MMDDGSPYHPEPCNELGHRFGCPGRAGGDHELDIQKDQPIKDDTRLALGKMVFEQFIVPDEPVPYRGKSNRDQASDWLEAIGFGRVEWLDGLSDDILLLALWRFSGIELIDEFIIEFSGYDAANIALFNLVEEVSL